jgi:hypothetical protein
MIALGGKSLSVPRIAKRALQVLTATGLTAIVTLFIIMANNLLLGRGVTPGFGIWLGFIQRPETIGTMVLTAVVTIGYLYWDKRSDQGGRR